MVSIYWFRSSLPRRPRHSPICSRRIGAASCRDPSVSFLCSWYHTFLRCGSGSLIHLDPVCQSVFGSCTLICDTQIVAHPPVRAQLLNITPPFSKMVNGIIMRFGGWQVETEGGISRYSPVEQRFEHKCFVPRSVRTPKDIGFWINKLQYKGNNHNKTDKYAAAHEKPL